MKICFIVSHFFPENNALTNRLEVLVPMLGAAHDVTVVFLLEPGHAFDEARIRKKFPQERLALVPVATKKYDKANLPRRAWAEVWNNVRLCWRAAAIAADVTWVSVPQLMLLPVSACFMPFRTGRRVVELRDFTWQYLHFGGGARGAVLHELCDRAALFAIRQFDRAYVVTDAQAAYLQAKGIPARVARNGLAQGRFNQLVALGTEPAMDGRFVVLYCGTVGKAQNLLTLMHAALQLRADPRVVIQVVGDGPELPLLQAFAAQHGLANVEFTGRLPWERVTSYYRRADVLYSQLKGGSGLERAEPTKLFEYLATGKAVIYGGGGAAAAVLAGFENVYLVEADDGVDLAKTISLLVDRPQTLSPRNQAAIAASWLREGIFARFAGEEGLDSNSVATRSMEGAACI